MCDNNTPVRPKDKIEKYLISLIKQHNGNFLETKYSRYFSFNGRVIRVSDHIGKHSSGVVSIIITEDKDYLLHTHSTNKIRNISYNDLKKLCKSWSFISSMWCDLAVDNFKFEFENSSAKTIESLKNQIKGLQGTISKKDLEINALKKGNSTLQKKLNEKVI